MNKLVLTLCFCIFSMGLMAQSCDPDEMFRDSSVGVYPLPYNPATMMGGLDSACQNQPYEDVLTFVIPETITASGITADLISIQIETTGALTGLPSGYSYACNPPDCFFEPSDTLACMIIFGTTDDDIGRYTLSLDGTATTSLLTIDLATVLSQVQTGDYYIDVLAEGDPNCTVVNTSETFASSYSLNHFPNPVADLATIQIEATEMNDFTLSITNTMGQLMESRSIQVVPSMNTFEMNTSQLPAGLYFYTLENEHGKLTKKMLVAASR